MCSWARNRVYVCAYKCLQLTNSPENPLLLEAKDSHVNISLETAIFYMPVLILSSSSPFIKTRQVSFLKLVSQDVIILLLQQISGLLGGCNLSSINSASSPNSVLLNSSQTLSSGSPALAASGMLPWDWVSAPRQALVLFAPSLPLFQRTSARFFAWLLNLVSREQTLSWSCKTPTSAFSFSVFFFCITSLKSVKPLAHSFPCLLGYSDDEREWQS